MSVRGQWSRHSIFLHPALAHEGLILLILCIHINFKHTQIIYIYKSIRDSKGKSIVMHINGKGKKVYKIYKINLWYMRELAIWGIVLGCGSVILLLPETRCERVNHVYFYVLFVLDLFV